MCGGGGVREGGGRGGVRARANWQPRVRKREVFFFAFFLSKAGTLFFFAAFPCRLPQCSRCFFLFFCFLGGGGGMIVAQQCRLNGGMANRNTMGKWGALTRAVKICGSRRGREGGVKMQRVVWEEHPSGSPCGAGVGMNNDDHEGGDGSSFACIFSSFCSCRVSLNQRICDGRFLFFVFERDEERERERERERVGCLEARVFERGGCEGRVMRGLTKEQE